MAAAPSPTPITSSVFFILSLASSSRTISISFARFTACCSATLTRFAIASLSLILLPGAEPVEQVDAAPLGSSSLVSTVGEVITPEQYIDARIPRVPDVPSSAPIYDELTRPVAYPKTICVSTKDEALLERAGSKMTLGYHQGRLHGCRCNTQQGTKVDISFDACMATVEHGAFDPAKPDAGFQQQGGGGVGLAEVRGSTTTQTPSVQSQVVAAGQEPQGPRVTVIPDSSRLPRSL